MHKISLNMTPSPLASLAFKFEISLNQIRFYSLSILNLKKYLKKGHHIHQKLKLV